MSLRVVLHPAAERDLSRLHRKDMESFRRVVKVVKRYAETERGDVKAIAPTEKGPLLRLEVGRKWWRVFFGVMDREVMYVVGIERRPTAYRPEIIEAARRRLKEFGVEID